MKQKIKAGFLVALTAILLLATVSGTWAFLSTGPQSITNIFDPAHVDTEILETFDGSSKSSVTIKNNSNIAVFIRVAVVGNWMKDGAIIEPWNGQITPAAGWKQNGGYYYYTSPVAAGGTTPNLLAAPITSAPRSDGAVLHLTILQQGIQAEPASVVQSTWGVHPTSLAGGGA